MGKKRVDVVIGAKDEYTRTIEKANGDFKLFGGNVGKFIKVGAAVAAAAIAALTVAIVKSVNAAREFNVEMANVATLIPGNASRIRELKSAVQGLSIATGKSTTDLAQGLFQVISAFGDTGNTAQKLEIITKAGVAGQATTRESLELLSAVTKGYGDTSVEALQKASDLSFITVKLGQTTFPELAASMGRVIPVAVAMGVSQEELFASMSTLTGVTGNASEVSTQLSGVLRAMIKPTTDMSKAIETLGFDTGKQMIQNLGLIGSIRELISTTDGTSKGIGKLFTRAEGLNAIFALTGGQADVFNTKLKAMGTVSGATKEAFKEQTTGINEFDFAVKQAKATFAVLLQKIGDFIIQNPRVIAAVNSITGALKEFARIIGFDVRTELENINHELGQLEAAMKVGATSLNDGSVAAQRYTELLIQKAFLLRQDKDVLDLHTEATKTNTEAVKNILNVYSDVFAIGTQSVISYTDTFTSQFEIQKTALQTFADEFTKVYSGMGNDVSTFTDFSIQSLWQFIKEAIRGDQARIKSNQDTTSRISSFEQNLSVAVGDASEAAFQVQKAIAIKRAGQATYLAANEAMAALSGIPVVGPALGTAAAAAIIAAGLANVAAIASESFTGGSTTTSDTASSISETGITDTTTTTSTTTGVINITLNNSSNIETTLEDLNDLLDKGYEINVATAIA